MTLTQSSLDTPALLIDLDAVDANLATMREAVADTGVTVRSHFKSLKCAGLARYLWKRGFTAFLAAKLCEAEVLADAGVRDLFVANQIVGPQKIARLVDLAGRCELSVAVDDASNLADISRAADRAGASLGVLVEVDSNMARCGATTNDEVVKLARQAAESPGVRFAGLQGYDGHNQHVADPEPRRAGCLASLERLLGYRRAVEQAGLPCPVLTTGGTGTYDLSPHGEGVTEIQPGSYVLMDCHYVRIAPAFRCALTVLSTVISRRPGQYVLDAGYKAASKDYELAQLVGRPAEEKVLGMSEEHTRVATTGEPPALGSRVELLPSHCCGTMNLHRRCYALRGERVEFAWPIEASGRYD
jgi:D-serine deaminase-like pyridoxal phosphate-dependent protein